MSRYSPVPCYAFLSCLSTKAGRQHQGEHSTAAAAMHPQSTRAPGPRGTHGKWNEQWEAEGALTASLCLMAGKQGKA